VPSWWLRQPSKRRDAAVLLLAVPLFAVTVKVSERLAGCCSDYVIKYLTMGKIYIHEDFDLKITHIIQ
jgi:hypothetical protein